MSIDADSYWPKEKTLETFTQAEAMLIMGPTEIGKNALASYIEEHYEGFYKVISRVTRMPRFEEGETMTNPYIFFGSPVEALTQLKKDIDRGLPIQVARHKTTGDYYWTMPEDWLHDGIAMIDMLTSEYHEKLKKMDFGKTVIGLVASPEDYWRRAEPRLQAMNPHSRQKRLQEALASLNYLTTHEEVIFINNPYDESGKPQKAGRFAVMATLEPDDYLLSDYVKNSVAVPLRESVAERLGHAA